MSSSQQSQMVADGVVAALADRATRKAWAALIARSVAKGVFFGTLALGVLAGCAWFVLAALWSAK